MGDEEDADRIHEIVQDINILSGLSGAQTEVTQPQPTDSTSSD